jgi:hypothetical protein
MSQSNTFKFRDLLISIIFIFAALTVCGCGGGAGGAGGNGSGGSNIDGGNDSQHGVRVFNAAVDAAPVDVISSISSSAVLTQQFFAGNKGYRSLSSGMQVLSLTRTLNPADVLASFSVDAASVSRYSILLYGDLQNLGLQTRIIEESLPTGFSGALIRVINGVAGAAALNTTISPGDPILVGFGQDSEYVATAPGEVRVSAQRSADGLNCGSIVVNAQEGSAYTVLFAGEAGFYTKAVLFGEPR